MNGRAKATPADVNLLAQSVERAFERIEEWRERRVDAVWRTPMLRSRHWLECVDRREKEGALANVYIKLESEQITGSFKVRGALNGVLTAIEKAAPTSPTIVTASTGNHALAMAHSLSLLSTAGQHVKKGKIFLPATAKEAKLSVLRTYRDVELEFTEGDDCIVSELAAGKYARCTPGATYLSPCDNYEVMSGNGTIAAEILSDLRVLNDLGSPTEPATIYVTVGGGGMISGIGSYLKTRDPGCWRVIGKHARSRYGLKIFRCPQMTAVLGVFLRGPLTCEPTWFLCLVFAPFVGCQPKNSAIMAASVEAGVVVHEDSFPTLSDGSAGGLEDGCLPLKFCSAVVDDFILVSEDEIAEALVSFIDKHHKICEGAAAVAIAAFMKDSGRSRSSPSVIVSCGANIGTAALAELLQT